MSIFEKASRVKLRFLTSKGLMSTEDLWVLSLQDLNKLAKHFNKEIKDQGEEDFISETAKVDETLQLKFDIVKRIISVKKTEAEAKAKAAERAAKRAQLIEMIGRKELTSMESQSIEDLKKQLAELD